MRCMRKSAQGMMQRLFSIRVRHQLSQMNWDGLQDIPLGR